MSSVNAPLLELFRSHGIEARAQDDWIVFSGSSGRASALIVREMPHPGSIAVQLDVVFEAEAGIVIVESFAGVGMNREEAVSDALHNFVVNSFHVLFAAFFRSDDKEVSQEEWLIGGKKRRVILGNVGIRGKLPAPNTLVADWVAYFRDKLTGLNLGPEIHWVRLYSAQAQGQTMACEVLLDNENWETVRLEMAGFTLPVSENFYGLRLFLVIRGEAADPATPEGAVSLLVQAMMAHPEGSEEEIEAALVAAGVSERLADRALKFTQIAWGRLLLESMPITFSPDYFVFDGQGRVVESGRLVEEPCFAVAYPLGARYRGTPVFSQIALRSADVSAVNEALNAGVQMAEMEDAVLSPSFVFVEEATAEGWERAQQVIYQRTVVSPGENNSPVRGTKEVSRRRPWWRFWEG